MISALTRMLQTVLLQFYTVPPEPPFTETARLRGHKVCDMKSGADAAPAATMPSLPSAAEPDEHEHDDYSVIRALVTAPAPCTPALCVPGPTI